MRTLRSMGLAMGACLGIAVAGVGCTATVEPVPGSYPVAYTSAVPPDITVYPHTVYAGSTVYFVNGRWYRHTPSGWVYYRRTPRELRIYRW